MYPDKGGDPGHFYYLRAYIVARRANMDAEKSFSTSYFEEMDWEREAKDAAFMAEHMSPKRPRVDLVSLTCADFDGEHCRRCR